MATWLLVLLFLGVTLLTGGSLTNALLLLFRHQT